MNGARMPRLSASKRGIPVRRSQPKAVPLVHRTVMGQTISGPPVTVLAADADGVAQTSRKRKAPLPVISRIVLRAGVLNFL